MNQKQIDARSTLAIMVGRFLFFMLGMLALLQHDNLAAIAYMITFRVLKRDDMVS